MSSRKHSVLDLLKKGEAKTTSQPTQKKKVICNCTTCNGKLVDIRTELVHRHSAQQTPKRQRSYLGLEMLNMSDQEGSSSSQCTSEASSQRTPEAPSQGTLEASSQRTPEAPSQGTPEASSQGTPEALNISLHVESEFSFWPRIRNPPLRTMSFDVEIGEHSVEIGEHSVEISEPSIEIGETSVEAGEDFDAYTEDADFSKT